MYPPVYPSMPITPDAAELLEIFEGLDPAERADLLAVARGMLALKQSDGRKGACHNADKQEI